jgi:RNA polymerase sigma factor (sigma-70 family)
MRLLRAMLGSRPEVDDLYQETILRAYLNLEQLRDPTRFGAWIYSIAVNLARTQRSTISPEVAWESDPHSERHGMQISPEAGLIQQEMVSRIRRAVEDLPPAERDAVALVYLEEQSHQEAARQLAASLSAVKVRVHRGRNHLRQALMDEFGQKSVKKLEVAMIKVKIHDIVKYTTPPKEDLPAQESEIKSSWFANTGEHCVVLLKEEKGTRAVPIWIGGFEAHSIAIHLKQNEKFLRPLTFDLVKTLLGLGNVQVQRADIHRLHEEVYYANLVIKTGEGESEIDCRPSDALNLAVRLSVAVYVAPEILDSQGRKPDDAGNYVIQPDKPDVEYESLLNKNKNS